MNGWLRICSLEEIPRLGSRVVESGCSRIALFRDDGNDVFAVEDRCPHKGGHLSQGIVCGRQVTCPLHGWTIALQEGKAMPPDHGSTRVYPVKVEAGVVFLSLEG